MNIERLGVHELAEPDRPPVRDQLPVLVLDTSELTPYSNGLSPQPSKIANITVPKRRYSVTRQDSLEEIKLPTFSRTDMRMRTGPSSPTTVLSLAGLFVCGILMMLSGFLVLVQQQETAFVVTGSIFLTTGVIMLLTCLFLQRKNLAKFILDMNRDLYFLNMSDSYMWRLMFDQKPSELPVQQ